MPPVKIRADVMKADDPRTALLVRTTQAKPLAVVVRAPGISEFRLNSGSCVIGSAPGCDIILQDPTVSRRHVELSLVREGVRVRDLESSNGTFYLGQRVSDMVLGIGSHLDCGNARFFIEADAQALEEQEPFAYSEYGPILGNAACMRRLFAILSRLEGSLATVLVEGESGVGKELVAQAIHQLSAVSSGPLVPINCGSISRELVGSELFGHKRGAFSGATEDRKGAFETAAGGTLFLDEIGELPLEVQPALLRVLESGEVRRIGSDRTERVRVRVVAATNRNLESEVQAGRFRPDLYYRLAIVRLSVPPLRERSEDIVPLARRFGQQLGTDSLPSDFLERLIHHSFPGNVRELRNLVEAFVAVRAMPGKPAGGAPTETTSGLSVSGSSIRLEIDPKKPYIEQRDTLVEEFTREYLRLLMEETNQNQTAAAKIAGLDRTYLGRLLAKHAKR